MALNYPTPNFSLNFRVYSRLVTRLLSHLELKHCELYELVLFECFPFLPASNRLFCMDKASVNHSTPRFLRNPNLNLGNCLQQMIGLCNNEKLRSFKSKEDIHMKEVGPYRGFGY